jgi:hypothetical protein
MRFANFVRTLGLLLPLGLSGLVSGCGQGSSGPISNEESEQIRASKKAAHQQTKVQPPKIQGGTNRRAPAGRGG